jgi:predicted nucleotidyltransferase
MMKTREKEIVSQIEQILVSYLNPSRIILFGSRAKEINSNKHADFDFAVDCPKPKIAVQRQINDEIEKISGLYKVDIVYLNSVEKEFQKIVLKTGKVIYERRD